MKAILLAAGIGHRNGDAVGGKPKCLLTDDVLIMDADMLCPDAMVEPLVRSPQANCFLLDGRVTGSGEEQMLMARGGRVYDIARQVKPGYDTVGESVGYLEVSRRDAPGCSPR